MKEFLTKNYLETQEIGKGFAKELRVNNKAIIIKLKGDLGAGKTTFMQGFAQGLKIKGNILSPTFIIFNRYPIKVGGFKNLYHFDCYRIEREEEILNLEFEDIISNKENIVCIEWPENIEGAIPQDAASIEFDILEGDKRKITINHEKDNFVIIDSNSIIHRAFHALPPLKKKDGTVVNAVYGFLLVLFKLIKELKPKYLVACFDLPEPTFRKQAFEQYKAHRKKAPQELYDQIPMVKDVLKTFNVPVFAKAGYEGDDLIGTLASLSGQNNIVVSGDLDNLQLINKDTQVYFLAKGVKNTVLMSEEDVKNKYDGLTPEQLVEYKGLRGDVSDNIPGVKGIGEKTAIKLIKEFGTIENIYNKIEEVTPLKLKEKLISEKENAKLSRILVEIKKDVPIEVNMKDCEWGGDDEKVIIEMLKEFDFNSLIKNISPEEKSIGQNLKLW